MIEQSSNADANGYAKLRLVRMNPDFLSRVAHGDQQQVGPRRVDLVNHLGSPLAFEISVMETSQFPAGVSASTFSGRPIDGIRIGAQQKIPIAASGGGLEQLWYQVRTDEIIPEAHAA